MLFQRGKLRQNTPVTATITNVVCIYLYYNISKKTILLKLTVFNQMLFLSTVLLMRTRISSPLCCTFSIV